MIRPALVFVSIVALSPGLAAQAPAAPPAGPPVILPTGQQIAGAVLALPADLRAGASVLGYDGAGKLVSLRKGTGDMVCLATDPKSAQFHSACYHSDMEPFMARGRALRATGVVGAQVDTVRFREVKEGKLVMPKNPSALYQLFGGTFDPVKGEVTGATPLYVVYIPFSTGKSTGLPEKPIGKMPWVMFPGTPKAHIMFTPGM
jgi:hypothetical protein